MISERALAEVHTSLWHDIAPNLPRLVRSLNLGGRHVFAPPMPPRVDASRLYFINEVGFEIFKNMLQKRWVTVPDVIAAVRIKFSSHKTIEDPEPILSDAEREDASHLARRLGAGIPQHIRRELNTPDAWLTGDVWKDVEPEFEPRFKGLGILDDAFGDIRFASNLVEVKSGDRSLRAADIKQVLIYYVLSTAESRPLRSCLIINPRQGYRVYFEFADLVAAVSGLSPAEFTATLRDYLVDWKACDSLPSLTLRPPSV